MSPPRKPRVFASMSTPSDNTDPLRIVIADDHRLVRGALARLVRSFAGMEVALEVDNGRALLDALAGEAVDLAIIDAAGDAVEAELAGLGTVAAVANGHPGVPVLVLAANGGPEHSAHAAGAGGLVTRYADAAQFEDAIRRVARGERFVEVPGRGRPAPALPPGVDAAGVALTLRQLEVLRLIVAGCRTKDIARQLGVSIKTVETHRGDLLRRLGVCNTAALVREALRLKLLPPTP